jgi:hypothetical protein
VRQEHAAPLDRRARPVDGGTIAIDGEVVNEMRP